jgi:hypothetical protein
LCKLHYIIIYNQNIKKMKKNYFLLLLVSSLFIFTIVQAQNTSPYWSLAGNSGTTATSSSKLGTTGSIPLNLTTNNLTRIRINSDGKVGIGTNNPQQRLHVESPSNIMLFVSTSPLSDISGSGQIGYTKHLPTAAGQRLGYFLFGSRGGAEHYYHGAGMVGYTQGAWSSTSWPAAIAFETTPAGSATRVERMRINKDGRVGIGVIDPEFLLEVGGRIRLRSGGGATAGLWLNKGDNTGAIGFIGAVNDNYLGLWGNTGAGWGLLMNSTNGNVGIGTTPLYPLHVEKATADRVIQAVSTFSGNQNRIGLFASANNAPGYGYGVFGSGGFRGVQGVGYGGDYNGSVYGVNGAAYGNNGIGSRYGVYGTAAYGSFNAAGYFQGAVWATSYHTISDGKFKQDVHPLENSLTKLLKLRPTSYMFKTEQFKGMHLPKGKQIGLIADEVKAVFPELVEIAVSPAEYDGEDRTKNNIT